MCSFILVGADDAYLDKIPRRQASHSMHPLYLSPLHCGPVVRDQTASGACHYVLQVTLSAWPLSIRMRHAQARHQSRHQTVSHCQEIQRAVSCAETAGVSLGRWHTYVWIPVRPGNSLHPIVLSFEMPCMGHMARPMAVSALTAAVLQQTQEGPCMLCTLQSI